MTIFFKQRSRFLNDGDASAGGGNAETTLDEAALESMVAERTAALEAHNKKVIEELRVSKERLRQYDGIDPVKSRQLAKTVAENEEKAALEKGDIESVLAKRTQLMADENSRLMREVQERAEKAEAKAAKFENGHLASALQAAARAAGGRESALDDFVLRGNGLWTMGDDGEPAAMVDGQPVYDKTGTKPLTPKEWAASLRENAPHLFPAPQGTGAIGADGKAFAGSMSRSKMSADDVAAYTQKHGRDAYLKLPK